jgi:hydroxymethylbilane synthase
MTSLRLGTRGSALALFQANTVAAALSEATGVACEIVVIQTSGDALAEARLSDIGGKRLFVKEIEEALASGAIDLAVHSSKDMSAVLPSGLVIAATLPREDPRDALVLPDSASFSDLDVVLARLGATPRLGTSSVRRVAQLTALVPGGSFLPVRGNLDTRLRKLDAGEFDAIVLASAGLKRLGRSARISAMIPVQACVPAPGQGIIAVEVRADDGRLREMLADIDDRAAHLALDAERAVVTALGGGCQMPLGAHAVVDDQALVLTALVISLDGTRQIRCESRGALDAPKNVGAEAARELLAGGAGEILAEVERAHSAAGGR